MTRESGWQRYRRRGEVTARRRQTDWTWTATSGEVMSAKAGDWAVIDDAGVEHSVAAEIFESTHEEAESREPHRYRRVGTVWAKRVTSRELVTTLEGDAVAERGDWIIEGQAGERWPVSNEHFHKTYEGPIDVDDDAEVR